MARSGQAPEPEIALQEAIITLDKCSYSNLYSRYFMALREHKPTDRGGIRWIFSRSDLSRIAVLLLIVMALLSGAVLHRALGADDSEVLSVEERLQQEFPLQYALLGKDYDGALAVMPTIADIDERSPITGLTALCVASKDESADAIDMVRPLVLKHLADVRQADHLGNTPLHHAAGAGNLAVVRFLIDNGANVRAENVTGATPYFTALENKRNRIAEYLLQFGAKKLTAQDTQQLNSTIVLKEAMGRVQDSMQSMQPSEGQPSVEGFRANVISGFDTAIESLQAEGNIEAVMLVEQFRENLLRAIDETPRPEEMSMTEWGKALSLKAGAFPTEGSQGGSQ